MLAPIDSYQGRTLNFAHRGVRSQAPENTLPAFELAASLGVDGIELDVRLSADSVPVVIHNSRVDCLTDGSGQVAEMTLARLKELDAGVSYGPQYAGTRIPTLREVFEAFGDRLLLNVELKPCAAGARLAELVAGMVLSHGLARMALISSFSRPLLDKVREVAPEIGLGYLFSPRPLARLLNGYAALMTTPYEALHPYYRMVDRRFVRKAHLHGYRVNVWTVNKMRDIRRLAALNVDMIIGDNPELVKDVLTGELYREDQGG
jgi:glycerophosphoryl diester phosphodiesterase